MNIGIIGSGNMGKAIGVRFTRLGHDVMFGARDAQAGQAAAHKAGGARGGTNDDAARHGDVLIWTIRESDPSKVLTDPTGLNRKTVIDVNNRDYANEVQTGAWFAQSIAERLQDHAPDALVVKALNLVAMESFNTSPAALKSAGAQVFIAGASKAAKWGVTDLIGQLGFEAVDVGEGRAALRAVEALGDVLRLLMIDQGHGGRVNLQLHRMPAPDLADVGPRQVSNYK